MNIVPPGTQLGWYVMRSKLTSVKTMHQTNQMGILIDCKENYRKNTRAEGFLSSSYGMWAPSLVFLPSQSGYRSAYSSVREHASSAFRFTVSPFRLRFSSFPWSGKHHRLIQKRRGKIGREQLNKQKKIPEIRNTFPFRPAAESIHRLVIGTYKPTATPSLLSHSSLFIAPPRSQQPVHTLS
jgi:hypothetical protein